MGFQREVIEAVMQQSRENLETADQAIEIMYDPRRHRFIAGFDLFDEV